MMTFVSDHFNMVNLRHDMRQPLHWKRKPDNLTSIGFAETELNYDSFYRIENPFHRYQKVWTICASRFQPLRK